MSLPSDQPSPNRHSQLQSTGCGILIGIMIGIVILLGVWIWMERDAVPPLTSEALSAGKALWKKNGPADYDLAFTTAGRQTGDYVVEVRSGKVVRVTRNGVDVPDRGEAWDARSIQGLFDTIDYEIDLAKEPQEAFDGAKSSDVIQQAEFDEQFGFPRRYRRMVLGVDRPIQWTVTEFNDRSRN